MTFRHFIHIGRNKAASTTLQQFFLAQRDKLAASGIDYYLWGVIAQTFPAAAGFVHASDYLKHTETSDRSTLISSENLLAFGPAHDGLEMLDVLRGSSVCIIAYVRDYVSWLSSQYSQVAANGFTTLNCDDFYLSEQHGVSVLPLLEPWAKEVGWSAMHIRSLDSAGLYGGSVVIDCANVLGLAPQIANTYATSRFHRSPHWLCTEIMRHLRAANTQADAHAFIADVVQPLRPIIDAAIALEPALPATVQYWTEQQAEWLAARYNADVVEISKRIEVCIPPLTQLPTVHRSFIPSAKDAPASILNYIREAVRTPSFQDSYPHAAWNVAYALSR